MMSARFPRAVLAALGMLLALSCGAAPAETGDVDQDLAAARQKIEQAQSAAASGKADSELLPLRSDVSAAATQAASVADNLAPQLAAVQARLAELGPAPTGAGAKEAADIAAQRTQLEKARSALDAQIKLARLLAVEGEQAAEQVSALRRSRFQARLGERTPSILAPTFWKELRNDLPADLRRLTGQLGQFGRAVSGTPGWVWPGLALLMVAITIAWRWLSRHLLALTSTRVPPGRLRRSLRAFSVVVLAVIGPGALAQALAAALDWNGALPPNLRSFSVDAVALVCFGGYVAGLGHALLSPARPSWRLMPLPDEIATRLRWHPPLLALMMVAAALFERITGLVNASLATAVAIDCVMALALGATLAWGVMRGMRMRRRLLAQAPAESHRPTPVWLLIVAAAAWFVLLGGVACLLIGYVAFGSFAVKQVSWVLVVVGSAYLLAGLVDDASTALLGGPPAADADAAATTVPAPHETAHLRAQAGVLLSALVRLMIVLFAAVLVLAPFGAGPADLFSRAGALPDGLNVGEVQIRPGAVLQAALVLVFGLFGVRLLKAWLAGTYLPTTRLDAGMRASTTTLFGYSLNVLAVALALSAAGIGLERIAWVASALSVGIGFGLQAVVQNFVSGLILLAERPVKVGDWVSLGGVEGDIKRINVRATEIQMGDRSTVIVPNSEFITKTVRNVTHEHPLGLVQIKLPLPLTTDAQRAQALLLQVLQDNTDLLDTPAPNVQLDGIDATALVFNATAFVSSPRLGYGVRSALLFEMLRRLREAGIELSKPSTLLLGPAPGLPAPGAPAPAPAAPLSPASP